MKKKYPLVEVKWEDAWSTGRHYEPENKLLYEPSHTTSIGFLLRRKPRYVLAQSFTQSGMVHDTLCIPKGCVRKVRRIDR